MDLESELLSAILYAIFYPMTRGRGEKRRVVLTFGEFYLEKNHKHTAQFAINILLICAEF